MFLKGAYPAKDLKLRNLQKARKNRNNQSLIAIKMTNTLNLLNSLKKLITKIIRTQESVTLIQMISYLKILIKNRQVLSMRTPFKQSI